MTYRFKSVPVISSNPSEPAALDGGVNVPSYDRGGIQMHELELSGGERYAMPLGVSVLVLAVTWTLGLLAAVLITASSHATWTVAEQQWASGFVAAILAAIAFSVSLNHEIEFRLHMKALADRQCGWRELTIFQDDDCESFYTGFRNWKIPQAHPGPPKGSAAKP
jgi:hypothetical protein